MVRDNYYLIVLGDTYEGEWLACRKHGRGADFFSNGDSYVGEYRDGRPQGQGIYTWSHGSIYEGEFKDGLKWGGGSWRKDKEDL